MKQPHTRPCILRQSRIKLSNSSLKILLSPTESVIPCSKTLLLKVHLETRSICRKSLQVNPSDLSRISYFGRPGPLQFKVEKLCQMVQFDNLNLNNKTHKKKSVMVSDVACF